MAKILSGKPVAEKIKNELVEKVEACLPAGRPVLAIVQVGDREDSNVYIKKKMKFGDEIGVDVVLKKFPEEIFSAELEQEIENLNSDNGVTGIIVQLPLPNGLDTEKILSLVKKEKDPEPATAKAVMEILNFYNILVEGKKVCVIGQGLLAGKAIASELENLGALVTRCDIYTENIPEIAKNSEILISAVGKPGLVTKDYVNESQVVIDVGFGRDAEGKLSGDVLFEEVEPLVSAITPVPGGLGPVTVACLFKNLIELASINS